MTREEARKSAEVMMAYAEGKDIEYRCGTVPWSTFRGDDNDSQLCFDFHKCEYRIKKEPTYRPFKNKEECWAEMQKHQPFGWVKDKESMVYHNINSLNDIGIYLSSENYGFSKMLELVTFADGTPFGIKEE